MTLLVASHGSALRTTRSLPPLEGGSFFTYKDWPMTFSEEFDSLNLLADGVDGQGWYPRYAAPSSTGGGYYAVDYGNLSPTGLPYGGFSTLPGEFEMYVDPRVPEFAGYTAFSLGPSTLIITIRPTPPELLFYPDRWQPFTSGCLISQLHGVGWSQSFGYFEGRIKLPAGYGTWPAFWMLTSDGNWPPEIDIIERFTSYPQDYIATTVHTRSNTPGFIYSGQAWLPDGPPHYQRFYSIFHSGDADPSNGFHLYGMEWTPDTITYYYDRQLVVTMVTPADLKDGRPMYLLLNFAADFNTTTWPGLTPVKMEIDWIRVWGMPVAPAPPIDGPSPWDGEWDTPGASIWDSGASLWDNG